MDALETDNLLKFVLVLGISCRRFVRLMNSWESKVMWKVSLVVTILRDNFDTIARFGESERESILVLM